LEYLLSDTQQSRDGIEEIERAKGDSFDKVFLLEIAFWSFLAVGVQTS
jgi:hypothetical protein